MILENRRNFHFSIKRRYFNIFIDPSLLSVKIYGVKWNCKQYITYFQNKAISIIRNKNQLKSQRKKKSENGIQMIKNIFFKIITKQENP